MTGKIIPDNVRAKLSQATKGISKSEATKAKISETKRGRPKPKCLNKDSEYPPYIIRYNCKGVHVGYKICCKYLKVVKSFGNKADLESAYARTLAYYNEHVAPRLDEPAENLETNLPIYETKVGGSSGYIACVTPTIKKVFSSQQYSMEEKYESAKKWYYDNLYRKSEELPSSRSATGGCVLVETENSVTA